MTHFATLQRDVDQVQERVGSAPVAGDLDASFEALYRARYRDVYRYALLMLRRPDDAEDVAGEVFQKAYAAWLGDRRPEGQPLPWLLVITRRVVIDRSRRRKLVSWLPLESLNPGHEPADQADTGRAEFWLWFDRFARELPDRQREVLILRYQRDLEDEQIGEIMGISASAVRSLTARACAALRRNPEIWR